MATIPNHTQFVLSIFLRFHLQDKEKDEDENVDSILITGYVEL